MYDYKIEAGPSFAELTFKLKQGETVKAEGGAMSYMDGGIKMETKSGGFFKAIKRSFGGESLFQNFFTGPGSITFASITPGDMIKLDINPDVGWIMQQDAFIASSPHLEISSKWGGFKSIFGGEGAFLTHVSTKEGPGVVFLAGYGYIKKHKLVANQEFVVDNGIFFATQETTNFRISKVGGKKSFFLGGEGIVMRFTGPGTVYTQSRSHDDFLGYIVGNLR